MRTPDELMSDLEDSVDFSCHSLVTDIIWEIIEDVMGSYRLAIESEGIPKPVRDSINKTVADAVGHYYGDL